MRQRQQSSDGLDYFIPGGTGKHAGGDRSHFTSDIPDGIVSDGIADDHIHLASFISAIAACAAT